MEKGRKEKRRQCCSPTQINPNGEKREIKLGGKKRLGEKKHERKKDQGVSDTLDHTKTGIPKRETLKGGGGKKALQ